MQALQGQWSGWRTKVARPIPEKGPSQVLRDGAFHLLNPVVKLALLRGESSRPVLCIEGRHWGALHNGISLHRSRTLMNGLHCVCRPLLHKLPACKATCGESDGPPSLALPTAPLSFEKWALQELELRPGCCLKASGMSRTACPAHAKVFSSGHARGKRHDSSAPNLSH